MKNKILNYAPYTLLFLLTVIFIFPVLSGDMYMGGDLFTRYFPWKTFLGESIRSGSVPLWNPHIFSGMPFIADVQKGAFYPLGVFYLIFKFTDAYKLYLLIHYCILSFGLFKLLRTLGFGIMPSLIGTCSSAFGSFPLASSASPAALGPLAFLPLTALMILRSIREGHLHNFILTSFLICVSFLSGSYPAFIYSMLFLVIFCFYIIAKRKDALKKTIFSFLIILLIAAACALITMPQSGLYNDLLKNMVSAEEMGYSTAAADSMGFSGILGLLLPPLIKIEGFNDFYRYINGTMVFMSITFIFLTIFSFFQKKDSLYKFSASVFIFSILLALGKNMPVHSLFYTFAPYLSFMLHPGYSITLLIIPASIMAAKSAEEISNHKLTERYSKKLLGVFYLTVILLVFTLVNADKIASIYSLKENEIFGFCMLFLIFTAGYALNLFLFYAKEKNLIRKNFYLSLLTALICSELVLFFYYINPSCPGSYYSISGPASESAKAVKTSAFRYISTATDTLPSDCANFEAYASALPSNTGIIYGINDASGYNDLKNRSYSVILSSAFKDNKPNISALNIMSVKYIVSARRLSGFSEYITAGGSYIYKNRGALPIFHVTSDLNAPRIIDSTASWTRKGKFDYSVYKAKISCIKSGYAVFSSSYYPGWNAYVDNRAENILLCYGIYMAVPVDSGTHEITFIYNPPYYFEYQKVFFISFVAFFAAAVFYIRRRIS